MPSGHLAAAHESVVGLEDSDLAVVDDQPFADLLEHYRLKTGLFLALLAAAPAAAQDCRLALALAIDVSSSVDAQEDALQRNGLAAALLAPEVQSAFFAAPQPVALAVYEWSGRFNQALVVDWQEIDSPLALAAVAATIRSLGECWIVFCSFS